MMQALSAGAVVSRGALVLLLAVSTATGATARPETLSSPQQITTPHDAIAALGLEVARLGEQGTLNSGQELSLSVKLDKAGDALAVGDPDAVLRPLNAFDAEVKALVTARVIDSKDSLLLRDLTARAIGGVELVKDIPFVLPGVAPCPAPSPCETLVLHVDAGTPAGGNGSTAKPYRSLAEAQAAAAERQACGVKIILHSGTYNESLTVQRATRIEGEGKPVIIGSLWNPTGHELEVSGVVLSDSPAPGAIVVDGPCGSSTEISNVSIRRARRYGVFQRRGTLRVLGTTIRSTVPDPSDSATGRAVRVVGGAQAVIGFTDLSLNSGGAVLAEGTETRVYLALSSVESNELHPLLAAAPSSIGTGIVEAGDGALLLSEYTNLIGNVGVGLLVGNGARGHFRYGRLEHSRGVDIPGEGSFYGINALAIDAGTLQMTYFRSNHAELVGFHVVRGYGRGDRGTIAYNTIGIGARDLPADFSVNELFACFQDVSLQHNDRTFDGDVFPLPCDGEGPGGCPACTVSVPFICTWCG